MKYKGINMNIGEKIKNLRKERKISQKRLAELSGISGSFLCDIEKGRTNPSIVTLQKIANNLNTEIKNFFEREED